MILPGVIASSGGVASSYESIATVTVGSGGSSLITLSSIPSTFAHLQLRFTIASTVTGATNPGIKFNNDSSAIYTIHQMYGNGSSVVSQAYTGQTGSSLGYAGTSYPCVGIVDILNYTSTNMYKTLRVLSGYDANGSGYSWFASGLWQSTSAISRIDISGSVNFSQYSSFALYVVKG